MRAKLTRLFSKLNSLRQRTLSPRGRKFRNGFIGGLVILLLFLQTSHPIRHTEKITVETTYQIATTGNVREALKDAVITECHALFHQDEIAAIYCMKVIDDAEDEGSVKAGLTAINEIWQVLALDNPTDYILAKTQHDNEMQHQAMALDQISLTLAQSRQLAAKQPLNFLNQLSPDHQARLEIILMTIQVEVEAQVNLTDTEFNAEQLTQLIQFYVINEYSVYKLMANSPQDTHIVILETAFTTHQQTWVADILSIVAEKRHTDFSRTAYGNHVQRILSFFAENYDDVNLISIGAKFAEAIDMIEVNSMPLLSGDYSVGTFDLLTEDRSDFDISLTEMIDILATNGELSFFNFGDHHKTELGYTSAQQIEVLLAVHRHQIEQGFAPELTTEVFYLPLMLNNIRLVDIETDSLVEKFETVADILLIWQENYHLSITESAYLLGWGVLNLNQVTTPEFQQGLDTHVNAYVAPDDTSEDAQFARWLRAIEYILINDAQLKDSLTTQNLADFIASYDAAYFAEHKDILLWLLDPMNNGLVDFMPDESSLSSDIVALVKLLEAFNQETKLTDLSMSEKRLVVVTASVFARAYKIYDILVHQGIEMTPIGLGLYFDIGTQFELITAFDEIQLLTSGFIVPSIFLTDYGDSFFWQSATHNNMPLSNGRDLLDAENWQNFTNGKELLVIDTAGTSQYLSFADLGNSAAEVQATLLVENWFVLSLHPINTGTALKNNILGLSDGYERLFLVYFNGHLGLMWQPPYAIITNEILEQLADFLEAEYGASSDFIVSQHDLGAPIGYVENGLLIYASADGLSPRADKPDVFIEFP